jgi:hypothetical protein
MGPPEVFSRYPPTRPRAYSTAAGFGLLLSGSQRGTAGAGRLQQRRGIRQPTDSSAVLNMITSTYLIIPDDEKPRSNSGRTGITPRSLLLKRA